MVRSLVRTTPIKQGSLPTSRVGLTLFGRVYSSYLKRKDKKIPKFGITDRKKYVQIGIILYYIEILAVKFFLSSICIALYFSISWLMYLIPILLHPVLCLRYDKRNGVVVIELATTEFWLKSSKPLQILDQSRTII